MKLIAVIKKSFRFRALFIDIYWIFLKWNRLFSYDPHDWPIKVENCINTNPTLILEFQNRVPENEEQFFESVSTLMTEYREYGHFAELQFHNIAGTGE